MSEPNNNDVPLPFGSSQWDRLPNEIKEMVVSYTSPLTLLVNGRLQLDRDRDWKTIQLLWTEAFDIDWPGDLSLLPNLFTQSELDNNYLKRVKSRSMYDRLCVRFPKASEINTKFADTDLRIETITGWRKSTGHKPEYSMPQPPFRLLHVPMRNMWLDVLGDTLDKYPYARANDCILEGHTDLLRHLIDTGRVDLSRFLRVCVVETDDLYYNVMDVAASHGHLDILKMLHEIGRHKATTRAMDEAAANGHFDIVRWLHENCTEGCTTGAMDGAIGNGHLDIVKWLHVNRTEGCTQWAMDDAAYGGHFDVIKWLHTHRTEGCTKNAMDWAAKSGHFNIVKFLHENRTEGCTTDAMDNAAFYGHFDIVKILHENRTEGCTHEAMDYSAMNGYLDIVKWLHENRTEGCRHEAMNYASMNGHLDIVRFLLDNRSEGVSDHAIMHCYSVEIAEMLVASLSLEQKREILAIAMSRNSTSAGVIVLRKSLDIQDNQP